MTLFAYIRDAVVVHISTSSGEPLSNATVVPVPEGSVVEVGYGYDGATFTSPPPVVLTPPTVSRVRFKMLWTPQERVETKKLRATDALIGDFWDLLDDPQTTDVVLALPSVRQAVEYTLSKIPVAVVPENQRAVRSAEILSGVLK